MTFPIKSRLNGQKELVLGIEFVKKRKKRLTRILKVAEITF